MDSWTQHASGADLASHRWLWLKVAAVAMGLALMSALVPGPPVHASSFNAPSFVRSIGGKGRAGIYAWGIQYNPVTGEMIVGDYLNYELRRFDANGNQLGYFFRSNNTGQPYSVAIDKRDGSIYTSEIADGAQSGVISKYDKSGNYKYTVTLNVRYDAWITVDDSGNLWVSDSHYWNTSSSPPMIDEYSFDDRRQTASLVKSWSGVISGEQLPRMYGIDVDSSGRVYTTDSINGFVHVWDGNGRYLHDIGLGIGTGPGQFSGDIREVVVDDANQVLYVVDATGQKIEKFGLDGTHLLTIDGSAIRPGGFTGRQATLDGNGNLVVADYGAFRYVTFDPNTGAVLSIFPNPPMGAPAGQLGEPRDVAVDATTGDVLVADSWNQRFVRFTAGGAYLGEWGSRGGSPPYGMNYPRGIGVDPVTGNIWVVNQRGHHIKVYDSSSNFLFQVGSGGVDSSNTGYFRWPLDVEFYNGVAIVSDKVSGYVKGIDAATGTELWRSQVNNFGLAVNPANGDIYVIDQGRQRIEWFDSGMHMKSSFGSRGSGNGQFMNPWDATIANGVLYVTDEQLNRVQAFDLSGNYLGQFGSTGIAPYQLQAPSGIASDAAGRLYIADATNDRIVVYDPSQARPAAETNKPTVTVTSPTNNAVLPGAAFTIAGTATDDTAVGNVEVAVRDNSNNLWWNGHNDTWLTYATWNLTPYTGAEPTRSVAFSFVFPDVRYGASYQLQVQSRDLSSNTSAKAVVNVTLLSNVVDTTDPLISTTVPTSGQSFPNNKPVVFQGTATDNVGVNRVAVGIENTSTATWLQADGTWGSAYVPLDAVMSAPGATSTSWTYTWPGGANGAFALFAQAWDAAGNTTASPPWTAFSVVDPDTTPPHTTVAVPTNNQVFAPGTITFSGVSTDNVAVAKVTVAIKNVSTGLWLQADGSWGSFKWLPATLTDTSNPMSVPWSYSWNPPGSGTYGMQARATDASGNVDPTTPFTKFTVTS
jgi:DNA-binding beta-propeller fold protein YncE